MPVLAVGHTPVVDSGARRGHNAAVNRSWYWLVPLLLAIAVLGAFYFDRQARSNDREIGVYVLGGQRMVAGLEIYRRGTDAKPFTYPPFAAVPFVPFVMLPASWYPEAWFVVNYLILLLLIRWLSRWATRDDPSRAPPKLWWFWILTAVFGGRHVVSVFTNQSHDLLICGLLGVVAAAWCKKRALSSLCAGAAAGLGAATKATPLLFVGLFGLRWSWLAVLGLVVALVAATLLPDHLFPRDDGVAWWRAWYDVNLASLEVGGTADARGAWNSHSFLNQSLSGTLTRWFRPVDVPDGRFVVGDRGFVLLAEWSPALTRVVTMAASLLVLALLSAVALLAGRAVRAAGTAAAAVQRTLGLGEVGAFACGMVLLSPQSSKAHFCVWLFPVAFVVDYLLRTRRDGIAMLLFAIAFGFGMLSKGLLGREIANQMLAWGSVAWATWFLLLAVLRCVLLELRRVGGAADGAPTASRSS